MSTQLSVKKAFYERYLKIELDKAEAELDDVIKNQKVWRCQSDLLFEWDILNYRIQQLKKQINKLNK